MIGAFDRSILIVFIRVADSSGAVHALGKRLNLFFISNCFWCKFLQHTGGFWNTCYCWYTRINAHCGCTNGTFSCRCIFLQNNLCIVSPSAGKHLLLDIAIADSSFQGFLYIAAAGSWFWKEAFQRKTNPGNHHGLWIKTGTILIGFSPNRIKIHETLKAKCLSVSKQALLDTTPYTVCFCLHLLRGKELGKLFSTYLQIAFKSGFW